MKFMLRLCPKDALCVDYHEIEYPILPRIGETWEQNGKIYTIKYVTHNIEFGAMVIARES